MIKLHTLLLFDVYLSYLTIGVFLLFTNFSFQVLILVASLVQMAPTIRSHMPVITEKYVELTCYQPTEGFLTPLAFNLFLLVVCAVHGFLVRKLPENFNESWYIFVSVLTTLFMWIVFLPTYFSMFYAYYPNVLLALCLTLNGFITLFTLYVPRLYAVYFISEEDMKLNTQTATTQITPVDG